MTCSNPALIVGAGPGADEEYAAARALYPEATVIGVNHAFLFVDAEILATLHPEGYKMYCREADARGKAVPPMHARYQQHHKLAGFTMADFPEVVEWHQDLNQRLSSGWFGAELARKLGHDEVILCGIPMNGTHSRDREICRNWPKNERTMPMKLGRADYKEFGARLLNAMNGHRYYTVDSTQGIFSMSGLTRELLGPPPRLEA